MAKCKTCQTKAANKTNTHYLTDSVIRTCLNEGGENTREKGLAYNISLKKNSIEPRFQRNTSQKGIRQAYGREATEEEIEIALQPLYSVNHVFCNECEDRFTEIEEAFKKTLSQFRNQEFSNNSVAHFDDISVRRFFLLQIYRTAVCDPDFSLGERLVEKLRRIIYEPDIDSSEIKSIPLAVTYLTTIGGSDEYTTNTVGVARQGEDNIVLFNDFVIQVFESEKAIEFVSFWGLNNEADFKDLINLAEDRFMVKVLDNDQRKKFLGLYRKDKAKEQLTTIQNVFIDRYQKKYGVLPIFKHIREFKDAIIYSDEISDEPRYSNAHLKKMLSLYLERLKP